MDKHTAHDLDEEHGWIDADGFDAFALSDDDDDETDVDEGATA